MKFQMRSISAERDGQAVITPFESLADLQKTVNELLEAGWRAVPFTIGSNEIGVYARTPGNVRFVIFEIVP